MMRLRITVHGAIYTAMGALLLISGLLRGELLSTVCGGLLTLYAGFAAAVVCVTAFCWKAQEPELTEDGGSFTVRPAPSKAARAGDARVFPPCVPGSTVCYTIEFSLSSNHTAKAAETVEILFIPLHGMQAVYYPENLRRGRYFYKRQYLNVRDFAGFFAVLYMQPPCLSAVYTVVQPVLPPNKALFLDLRSRAVNDLPSQERTHELYESRPYFPGDDPRKIHWKLYAHTQTISIKLGAFEPPPVKRLTVYIEEPVVLKKERAAAASVFDAFIGRLSAVIVQLLNAGIQCSLLLYNYPQKALQHYELIEEGAAAVAQIQNRLAVPTLRFSPEAVPDAVAVFNAVHDGGLLYCYVPTAGEKNAASQKSPAGEKASVYKKIAACNRSNVETLFCLAAPPLPKEHTPADSRVPDSTVSDRTSSLTAKPKPSAQRRVLGRRYIHRLLYSSAVSARQEVFDRNLQEATERELRIFTAGDCHAELL